MQVSIDEIGVKKIQRTEFFLGDSISDHSMIYFAPLDEKRGPEQRWIVIDQVCWENKDGYIVIYTTEEMQLLCRSMKDASGKPVKAGKEVGYRFLVRSGKVRMRVRDGCTGCRNFWGPDFSAFDRCCSKCNRCRDCCKKGSVPYSCASGQVQETKKRSS
jgi:hypothetical protein